ncbi:hypothetical protein [Caminibacter pacificus]
MKLTKEIIISIAALIVFAFTPLFNKISQNYIDNSLKQAAVSYAITRSINAAVSIVQNSSVSLGVGIQGNVAIGEALDPINDATERFSDLLTLSIWTLGAEKVLFELSNLPLFIAIVIVLALINIYFKSKFLSKLLILMIVLKIFIPFSSAVSFYSDKYLFSPQIQKINKELKPYVKEIKIEQKNQSFWDRIKQKATTFEEIKAYAAYYLSNTAKIINALINLGSIYLGKLLLNILILPLIFVYIVKNIRLE